MTNPIRPLLTCEQFSDSLADFLERDVPETTRAAMESHAVSCAECGPLLADLRKMRLDAANLPELVPGRDLWAGIESRISTPVIALPAGGGVERWRGRGERRARIWIGLAAAGLVAITAGVTHELTKRAVVADSIRVAIAKVDTASQAPLRSPAATPVAPQPLHPSTSPPASASTQLASNTKPSAEATYDTEIRRLRKLVAVRRSDLDSATIVVIDKNLKIIDDAIAQCRNALKTDPASAYLLESLDDAMNNKIQLLRTAAALPSRM